MSNIVIEIGNFMKNVVIDVKLYDILHYENVELLKGQSMQNQIKR
jgi:hypothetical protein